MHAVYSEKEVTHKKRELEAKRRSIAGEMAVMSLTERVVFVSKPWLPIEAWQSAPF